MPCQTVYTDDKVQSSKGVEGQSGFVNAGPAVVVMACLVILLGSAGCASFEANSKPAIQFTQVPAAGPGGAAKLEPIAGRVVGASKGQGIVLFAKAGTWWVQPFATKAITAIQPDGTFNTSTHLGSEYAALLVEPGYAPPNVADVLPNSGAGVIAVATVQGRANSGLLGPKQLHFSGYDWDVYQVASDSFGVMHANSATNAWTDENGRLHLRLIQNAGEWSGAELNLTRSLGYGSYSFTIRDAPLEEATVLGLFCWDPLDGGQNHREMSIQLSQLGEPTNKNAQYTIAPYYIPANLHRFTAPASAVTHSFRWEPGRVTFRTTEDAKPARLVAEHVFSSGVPAPGGETVHIKLYVYGRTRTPQRKPAEVLIERFAYLP